MAAKKSSRKTVAESVQRIEFDISWMAIVKVLAVLAALYFGIRILQVLLVLFFAFVIASALLPVVGYLSREGMNRWIAIGFTYVSILLVMFILGVIVMNPLAQQVQTLIELAPSIEADLTERLGPVLNSLNIDSNDWDNMLGEILSAFNLSGGQLAQGASNTLAALTSVGSVIGSSFLALVLSVFIIADRDSFVDLLLLRVTEDDKRDFFRELIHEVESKLGQWLASQTLLMFIIGAMTYLALLVLGIDFALPLAVIAGLMVMIPNLGPLLSVIPTVFVALATGTFADAVMVVVAYIVIQQVDAAFITPRIMGNVAGVKPVFVFVGLLLGFSIGGVFGAILTVPVIVLLRVAIDFYNKYKKL